MLRLLSVLKRSSTAAAAQPAPAAATVACAAAAAYYIDGNLARHTLAELLYGLKRFERNSSFKGFPF